MARLLFRLLDLLSISAMACAGVNLASGSVAGAIGLAGFGVVVWGVAQWVRP